MEVRSLAQGRVKKILAFIDSKKSVLTSSKDANYQLAKDLQTLSQKGLYSERTREYDALKLLADTSGSCLFQTGFELGEHLFDDPDIQAYGRDVLSQHNFASGLLAAYSFVKQSFTFSHFEFSFSGYHINIRSNLLDKALNDNEDESLRRLLLGRNIGMMLAMNRASMFGSELAIDKLYVDIQHLESLDQCALENGFDVVYEHSGIIVSLDARRLNLRYFLLNQLLEQMSILASDNRPSESLPTKNSVRLETDVSPIPDQILRLFNEGQFYLQSKQNVARALNISPRTLGRRLQEQGTTWRKLVSDFRMEKSKSLLRQPNMTLQHVADLMGFSSLSAFSSAFSKAEGLSPSEFVRQALQ